MKQALPNVQHSTHVERHAPEVNRIIERVQKQRRQESELSNLYIGIRAGQLLQLNQRR